MKGKSGFGTCTYFGPERNLGMIKDGVTKVRPDLSLGDGRNLEAKKGGVRKKCHLRRPKSISWNKAELEYKRGRADAERANWGCWETFSRYTSNLCRTEERKVPKRGAGGEIKKKVFQRVLELGMGS